MTTTEQASLIGKQATYTIVDNAEQRMHFHVTILDARAAYGRIDAKITPVAGAGSRWVRLDSLEIGESK